MSSVTRGSRPITGLLPLIAVSLASALAALYASAKVDATGPLMTGPARVFVSLPIAIVFGAAIGAVALAVSIRLWWAGTVAFFLFLPFEDLARKFAGNDLRVYFVKYALLAVAFVGALPRLRGAWRRPLAEAWGPTIGLLAMAGLFAIPSAVVSPGLPIVGLATRFAFLLMFPIGVAIGRQPHLIRRLYVSLSIGATAICLLGLIQRVIGPTFLNPSVVDPRLTHLSIVRVSGQTQIVRPAGPFVDATRFANATTLAVVLALCVLSTAVSRSQKVFGTIAIAMGFAAAIASGSRAAAITGVAVVVLARVLTGSLGLKLTRQVAAYAVLAALAVGIGGPAIVQVAKDNVDFLGSTLNPFSSKTSDLVTRTRGYIAQPFTAVRHGAVLGDGTGTQSLGRQYLQADVIDPSNNVESGFASVAKEWGVLGLAMWCGWSVMWSRRVLRARSVSQPDIAVIGAFVILELWVLFWLGVGQFDTYLTNILFWFLSGVAIGRVVARELETTTKSIAARTEALEREAAWL